MKTFWKEFSKMLITSNPLFVVALGNCPALAITITMDGALGMAVGLAFALFFTSMMISALRKYIPNSVRIPIFVVIGATFVTMVDLTFKGYVPAVWALLGIYLPLITVNCNLLGRAEVFAQHNPVIPSIGDALGTGVGYGLAMLVIAIPRVLLGNGTFTVFGAKLFSLPVLSKTPINMFVLPTGALLILGLVHGLLRRLGVERRE